jgi:hypothetical protein
MYLFHNVRDEKTLLKIIKDEKLKAGYLTGNINEGDGIYLPEDQKFVFFSCIDKLNSKLDISNSITLFFDYKLLYNRTYYVSTCHSAYPDELSTWNNGKDYKKKYKQYYKKTKDVLTKLFKNAISKLPKGKAFQVFQQIAIKKQCNLNNLVQIIFNKKPSDKVIKIIKDKYPDVIIKFKK